MRVASSAPASGSRGPFDPPLLSVSPRNIRRVSATDELTVVPVSLVREELWARGDGVCMAAALVDGNLALRVTRSDGEELRRRLIRMPIGRRGISGAAMFYGRWEFGKDAAVFSPSGAGVTLSTGPREREAYTATSHELVDVYEGEGVRLALHNLPNGARVVAADGLEGLGVGTVLSDLRMPDIMRGPEVDVHPREAFLRGFPPIGFRASFAGLAFEGFAPTKGDGSRDLARFTRKPNGLAFGAVRPVQTPADPDALLHAALTAELKPTALVGRVRVGKPGTITLTDGRRYRVQAGVREYISTGLCELVACLLLDDALLVTVGAPTEALCAPDAKLVLKSLQSFLLGLHLVRGDGPSNVTSAASP